ncbi:MAG: WD40/YVTN/BNR-like repeat-containing protein [Acidimicrobiales bacterium]
MTICVGTIGSGVHISRDGGGRFKQIFKPVPFEGNVRALRVDPSDPATIYCGTDEGLFRTVDGGARWAPMATPAEGRRIWSVAVDPNDSNRIYVGVQPGGFRSTDGGNTWEEMAIPVRPECLVGPPRTTNVVVDPRDSAVVWAGAEIDGVFRSTDHGATWARCNDLGPGELNGDVHGVAIQPTAAGNGSATVLVGGPFGLTRSTDEGESWELTQFPGFHPRNEASYCRAVMVKADDPQTIFVGTGDSIPGETGGLRISRDGGETWTLAELPETPNSVVYWMANHPARPEVVACASLFGQLFWSTDSGHTWEKCHRGFGEIRALALAPSLPAA